MSRAEVTSKGFVCDGKVIQGSYTFSHIKLLEKNEFQNTYSALMQTPISVPCTITVGDSFIAIVCADFSRINITY